MKYKELEFLLKNNQPNETAFRLGEYFYDNPSEFKDSFIALLDKKNSSNLRLGTIIILTHIAKVKPEQLIGYKEHIIECLKDKRVKLSNYSAKLIGCIGCSKPIRSKLPEKCEDFWDRIECLKSDISVKVRPEAVKSYKICYRDENKKLPIEDFIEPLITSLSRPDYLDKRYTTRKASAKAIGWIGFTRPELVKDALPIIGENITNLLKKNETFIADHFFYPIGCIGYTNKKHVKKIHKLG